MQTKNVVSEENVRRIDIDNKSESSPIRFSTDAADQLPESEGKALLITNNLIMQCLKFDYLIYGSTPETQIGML